jgi:hypothetical protein
MIKLKEVIIQLKEENYSEIENNLVKNKADRFLFLLRSYKQAKISDNEIKNKLGVTANSFYVLKSRLYDKIQDSLSCDIYVDQEKTIKLLLQVPELCLNTPRETSIAYLLKLEKDLLRFDMHNELLVIYSALKKLHINSDKYYHYSQTYNKQVSLSLSLEKAEETLGNFCRILSQYDLSRSKDTYEKLCFLKKEISNVYDLCNTRQVELIKNLIDLHLFIFCKDDKAVECNIDELLQYTRIIFDDLPLTLPHKKWEIVLDYLCFEYYYSIGSNKAAIQYFEKVNGQLSNLLLFNHIGFVSKFLTTKISFCVEFNKLDLISDTLDGEKLLIDVNDVHTQISIKVHNALVCFYQKKYKVAINYLNVTLNEFVFKDYFHEFLNIKLSLMYFYITIGDFEKAQACIKVLSRRIKMENNNKYNHILYLLKSFDCEINKESSPKNIIKQRDLFILFTASNTKNNGFSVIPYLLFELRKKHQI